MNPFSIVKKVGKIIRGGISIRQVFLGILLGFAIGVIPGFNLITVILILALLILNVNFSCAFLALAAGKGFALSCSLIMYNIGYHIVHTMGFGSVIAKTSETPVLAFLDLDVYCVVSGIIAAIVIGLPVATILSFLLNVARKKIVETKKKSEKIEKVSESKITKILLWLIFGKQKQALEDSIDVKGGWLNKKRTIGVGIVAIIMFVVTVLCLDMIVKKSMISTLEMMNGAEVNIEKIDASLIKGKIIVYGLQIGKRSKPDENRFSADELTFIMNPSEMWCKRFNVSLIEAKAMNINTKRATPAKVFVKTEKLPPEQKELEESANSILKFPEIKSLDDIKVYQEKLEKLNSLIEKIKKYQAAQKAKGKDPSIEAEKKIQKESVKKGKSYLRLSAAEFLTKKPAWEISLIKISEIMISKDLPGFSVNICHLSSNPALANGEFDVKVDYNKDKIKELITAKVMSNEKIAEGKAKAEKKVAEGKAKVQEKIAEGKAKAEEKAAERLNKLFKKKDK